VRRAHVEAQLLDHARQARCLAAGQLEHQPGQRRGVDHGVLEGLPEAPADQVGVEGVMAVLDQDRAPGEAQEGGAGIAEAGRADQHRAVDLVALLRVAIDRRPGLHQRVEERQRPRELESLGADLDHQEGRVAGRLDVEGHVLGLLDRGVGGDGRALRQQLGEERERTRARLEPDIQ
jgi:hypothetical protein